MIATLNVELFIYALVAAISPLGLAAALAVIASGRLKSFLFALGVVFGQLVACTLVVLVDASLLPIREHKNSLLRGALEVTFGVGLVWLALVFHRRSSKADAWPIDRSGQLLERLQRLNKTTAGVGGFLLGIGGPKRLLLTALAGTSIAASGANGSRTVALIVSYTFVATLLVWAPVLAFGLAGDRVAAKLGATQRWLANHEHAIGFYSLLAVGVATLAQGLSLLT